MAVFGGPVFCREIEFSVLLIILLPASGIEAKHLRICIGADHCPAVILFSVLRQARAHYASLAAKKFHMLVPYKSCLKLLKSALEIASSLSCNDISCNSIIIYVGSLKESSCYGEYCPPSSVRCIEV